MPTFEEFRLPDAGEGLTEAEIVEWHVAVGDTVEINQTIVEIETAKSVVELPSPFAGLVTELLVEPGITVEVGTPIIVIDTDPTGSVTGGATATRTAAPAAAGAGQAVLVGYGVADDSSQRRARRGTSVPAVVPPPVTAPRVPALSPAVSAPAASAPAAAAGRRPPGATHGQGVTHSLAKPPVR